MSDPEPIELVIAQNESGERIDRVLAAREVGASRSTLRRWIDEGRVRMDGRAVEPSVRARAGAKIVIHPAPAPPSRAVAEDIRLVVLHEDAHILVIDKPAGMVVHPAPGHPGGTLVNALLYRGSVAGVVDSSRPGIVHRLDKDTSGVLVVAKTDGAREALIAQFKLHTIERRYRALVLGVPPVRATYDTLHARHARDRKRFTSKTATGRRAVTHLRVLEQLHASALVECSLETGRTHQIRVHLAERGFPVLGDRVYGRTSADLRLRAAAEIVGHHALHAAVLGFLHPATGATLRFETPAPAEFLRAIPGLRL